MCRNRFWIIVGLFGSGCLNVQQDLIGDSDRPIDVGDPTNDFGNGSGEGGEGGEEGGDLGDVSGEEPGILTAENIVSSVLETEDPNTPSWEEELQIFVDENGALDSTTLMVEHTLLWSSEGVTTIDVEWDGETRLDVFYDQSQQIEKDTWVQVTYSISLTFLPSADYTLYVESSEAQFLKE